MSVDSVTPTKHLLEAVEFASHHVITVPRSVLDYSNLMPAIAESETAELYWLEEQAYKHDQYLYADRLQEGE